MFKAISSLLLLAGLTEAKTSPGYCPNVPVVQNFQSNLYTGRWYEVMRDANAPHEENTRCTTTQYVANADGTLGVTNRAEHIGSGYYSINAIAHCQPG